MKVSLEAPTSCLSKAPTFADNDDMEIIPVSIPTVSILSSMPTPPVAASRRPSPLVLAKAVGRGKAPMTSLKPEKASQFEEYIQIEVEVRKITSAIRNKGLAEKLVKMTLLPQDQEKWKSRPLEKIIKYFFLALIEVSTSNIIIFWVLKF